MPSSRTLSRLPWVWFAAWLLVGAGYALSFIAIASIGLFVLPLPVLATLLARRRQATSGLPGLLSGLAVPVLYVAYLNRAGPGTICTTVAGGQECHDEWSPWPWLAVGVILLSLESPRSSIGSDEPVTGPSSKIQIRWCRPWVSPDPPQRPESESFEGRVVSQGRAKQITARSIIAKLSNWRCMAQELLVTDVYDAAESLQRAAAVLANAQVRATLAVAGVLGLSANLGAVDMQAWRDVAATRR